MGRVCFEIMMNEEFERDEKIAAAQDRLMRMERICLHAEDGIMKDVRALAEQLLSCKPDDLTLIYNKLTDVMEDFWEIRAEVQDADIDLKRVREEKK